MFPTSFSNHCVALVSSATGVRRDEIESHMRRRDVAHARQLAMYLTREIKKFSFPTIGKQFRRDHSTVLHACDQVKKRMAADPDYAALVATMSKEAAEMAKSTADRARERTITEAKGLPLRITTSQVCDLAGYGPATLSVRIRRGLVPAPIDKGLENIFDRDAVLKALGLVDEAKPEEATW